MMLMSYNSLGPLSKSQILNDMRSTSYHFITVKLSQIKNKNNNCYLNTILYSVYPY